MAPECVRNKGSYLASDIWSLGVLLHLFYTGVHPFRGGSDYLIFKRSTERDFNRDMSTYPLSVLPKDARDLIDMMLQIDHEKRPTID